jgi:hypothetical protein
LKFWEDAGQKDSYPLNGGPFSQQVVKSILHVNVGAKGYTLPGRAQNRLGRADESLSVRSSNLDFQRRQDDCARIESHCQLSDNHESFYEYPFQYWPTMVVSDTPVDKLAVFKIGVADLS